MFPLNSPTVFHLVLIGVVLSSALALQFGWRWRIPLVLLGIALPAGFLWSAPPIGEYAGLAYIIVAGASVGAFILGLVLGGAMRLVLPQALTSVAVLVFATAAFTGFELRQQYVPSACLKTPLQVRIAGTVLSLPPELRPRLENGKSIGHFGRSNRKSDFARFCRMSKNGTRVIDMDTVWITPASNHKVMTPACNVNEPPIWCNGYSSDPYRHIGKFLISSDAKPVIPLPYWREGGSLKTDRQGDLTQGSVCLLPDVDIRTQCWIWQPFGDGSRLTISTSNLDQTFDDMPIEEARKMIRQAREITLAIIKQ